jgi:mRNA interferase MazF
MDVVRPRQFDVYWADLNPTRGAEISKIRPCVIVSPDDINDLVRTIVAVPLTTTLRSYPMRLRVQVGGQASDAATDQIRAIDRQRLKQRIGRLAPEDAIKLSRILVQMFAVEADE